MHMENWEGACNDEFDTNVRVHIYKNKSFQRDKCILVIYFNIQYIFIRNFQYLSAVFFALWKFVQVNEDCDCETER